MSRFTRKPPRGTGSSSTGSSGTGSRDDSPPTNQPERAAANSSGGEQWPSISFEDRMATAHFDVHEKAHIVVDADSCNGCSTKECVVACPANLFVPTSDGGIVFNYEQCFECGTCYLVCNKEGAISWSYPEGGFGVVFRRT